MKLLNNGIKSLRRLCCLMVLKFMNKKNMFIQFKNGKVVLFVCIWMIVGGC